MRGPEKRRKTQPHEDSRVGRMRARRRYDGKRIAAQRPSNRTRPGTRLKVTPKRGSLKVGKRGRQ